jgi:hypothetical protein
MRPWQNPRFLVLVSLSSLSALSSCSTVTSSFQEMVQPETVAVAIAAEAPSEPQQVEAQEPAEQPAQQDAADPEPVEVAAEPEAAPEAAPPPPPSPKKPRPKDAYQALRYDITAEREMLAYKQALGEDVYADTLATLDKRLPELINAWKGTRWSYSGTTQVPKTGKIACGYFVSTVLQHAGFKVDRVDLARQPSEQIIRSVIPDPEIDRFYGASRDEVVRHVEKQGLGVYVVGLDTHIGFLVNEKGKKVNFCHSTRRNKKAGVVCEVARTSESLKSRYTVLGKLGEPQLLDAWLAGADLPAARKFQPQSVAMSKVIDGDALASNEADLGLHFTSGPWLTARQSLQ